MQLIFHVIRVEAWHNKFTVSPIARLYLVTVLLIMFVKHDGVASLYILNINVTNSGLYVVKSEFHFAWGSFSFYSPINNYSLCYSFLLNQPAMHVILLP